MWSGLQIGLEDAFQILAMAWAYYYVFLFFRGTRGAQVLVGLALVLVILTGLTQVFSLNELNWVLRKISVFLGLALLVIFQPEIRRALAELGRQPVFVASAQKRNVVDHIVNAVAQLADQRVGALIAVEREIGTRAFQETGVKVDATVSPELLASIFFPHTPLHDGGVIIRGNKIVAAGCVFPLTQNADIQKQLGTRHRAAIGICEETDAVAVVVSEETGTISVAHRGRLSRGLNEDRLRRFLTVLLVKGQGDTAWRRAQVKLDLTPEGIAKADELAGQEDRSAD